MKWFVALVAIGGCSAAAVSRVLRILHHVHRGGPMMKRRILGSVGVGLASLGWAFAVLLMTGLVHRGPRLDWFLLLTAAAISVFMAWTLWRADAERVGGDVLRRQLEAKAELDRVRGVGEDPTGQPGGEHH